MGTPPPLTRRRACPPPLWFGREGGGGGVIDQRPPDLYLIKFYKAEIVDLDFFLKKKKLVF